MNERSVRDDDVHIEESHERADTDGFQGEDLRPIYAASVDLLPRLAQPQPSSGWDRACLVTQAYVHVRPLRRATDKKATRRGKMLRWQ